MKLAPRFFFAPIVPLAFLTAASCAATPEPPTLQNAADAYFQMRVADAERLFRAVAQDPEASALDVSSALRGQAGIQWLIDDDARAAQALLHRATAAATGDELCRVTTMYVRVLRESGQPAAGVERSNDRAADCPETAQHDGLLLEQGKAAFAWGAATTGSVRERAFTQVQRSLDALSPTGGLGPAAASLKLALSLERSDAVGALRAWREFFWLVDSNAPASFKLADPQVAAIFTSALGPKPALEEQIRLERLLIRGGFYPEALRFDHERGVALAAAQLPAYVPVAAYFKFRDRFDQATLAFNRKHARGSGSGGDYLGEVNQILADTAEHLGERNPTTALEDAFGVHWMIGTTGGVSSVHMGHVVDDTRYKVVQFGRSGEVRFRSIDNMISNGYQSWLWDGLAATGGWSDRNAINQIRSIFTSAPLKALASFAPDMEKTGASDQLLFEARDREILKSKRVAFLPGLQARLKREARDQIAAKARAEAQRTGAPFEQTFLKVYWDVQVEQSIYIHEGRHVLDHRDFDFPFGLGAPELEYRAKLAELELGEFPRLSLFSILVDVESATPHGQADRRIMEGICAWMDAHQAAIEGYDRALPVAEQIDKLNDDQFRLIARVLDPYFKGHAPA